MQLQSVTSRPEAPSFDDLDQEQRLTRAKQDARARRWQWAVADLLAARYAKAQDRRFCGSAITGFGSL